MLLFQSLNNIPHCSDNSLVVSNSLSLLQSARCDLCNFYDVKWNDSPSEHLGIKITRDCKLQTIRLSQESYLQHVLDCFGMDHSNAVATPLHSSTCLASASDKDIAAHSALLYREILGCLNHAAVNTRPECCITACAVLLLLWVRACNCPKHLLCYVKGTLDIGLVFRKHSVDSRMLSGYADANYADGVNTRRSTTGHTITVGGSTVCWRSRWQRSVALSTTEAKYMAMGDCAKHLLWFWCLLYILTMQTVPTAPVHTPENTVFNDNNGAVFLSKEEAVNSQSKHIDISHHC